MFKRSLHFGPVVVGLLSHLATQRIAVSWRTWPPNHFLLLPVCALQYKDRFYSTLLYKRPFYLGPERQLAYLAPSCTSTCYCGRLYYYNQNPMDPTTVYLPIYPPMLYTPHLVLNTINIVIRCAIIIRTCDQHKNPYIHLLSLTIYGPEYYFAGDYNNQDLRST